MPIWALLNLSTCPPESHACPGYIAHPGTCPPLVNNDDKVDNLEENMLVIVIDLARFAPHPDYNEQLLCDDDDHPLMLISHKLFTGKSHYCAKRKYLNYFSEKNFLTKN